jgi:hypothetical protein
MAWRDPTKPAGPDEPAPAASVTVSGRGSVSAANDCRGCPRSFAAQLTATVDCDPSEKICKIYTGSHGGYAVDTVGEFLFTFRKGIGAGIEVYKA